MHRGGIAANAGVLVAASGSAAVAQPRTAALSQHMDIVRADAPTLKIRETRFGFLDVNHGGSLAARFPLCGDSSRASEHPCGCDDVES